MATCVCRVVFALHRKAVKCCKIKVGLAVSFRRDCQGRGLWCIPAEVNCMSVSVLQCYGTKNRYEKNMKALTGGIQECE